MSGAYEHNWKKHPVLGDALRHSWQNRLTLYNTRLSNLSAALVRAKLPMCAPTGARRAPQHHDRSVVRELDRSPWLSVAGPARREERAHPTRSSSPGPPKRREVAASHREGRERGVTGAGLRRDCGQREAFWNWRFSR